jgi:hypothetical protein
MGHMRNFAGRNDRKAACAEAPNSATKAFFLGDTDMFLKFGLSFILLSAALPTAAQPPAAASPAPPAVSPEQQAAIQRTAMAFGQCISTGMQTVSPSVTPEAGAATLLGGCATQRVALIQSVEAMIATMPEPKRAEAHARLESQMGQAQIQAQIADGIRQLRAAPPAAPAPATPPPH